MCRQEAANISCRNYNSILTLLLGLYVKFIFKVIMTACLIFMTLLTEHVSRIIMLSTVVMTACLIFMTLLIEHVSHIIMLSAILSNHVLHRFFFSTVSSVTTSCNASNVMLWLAWSHFASCKYTLTCNMYA